MNINSYFVLFMATAFSLATFALEGSILHVDCGGDDTNGDGTAANPYATIHKAVSQAGDGDIVRVHEGDYAISGQIAITNGIAVEGDGVGKTVVRRFATNKPKNETDTGQHRIFLINHANAVVQNLEIADGYLYNSTLNTTRSGAGVLIGENGGTLAGVLVRNCSVYWQVCGGGISIAGPGIVTNCVIDTCSTNSESWNSQGGALYASGTDAKIFDTTIRNTISCARNRTEGVAVYLSGGASIYGCIVTNNASDHNFNSYGGGIFANGASRIENCLVADNRLPGRGGGICLNGNSCVRNCTIVNNRARVGGGIGVGGEYNNGSGVTARFENCIIQNNVESGAGTALWPEIQAPSRSTFTNCLCSVELPTLDAGNETANVLFVDTACGDYRPSPVSASITADRGYCPIDTAALAVDFVAATSPMAGSSVTFNAFAIVPDGETAEFRWKFGDGAWTAWSSATNQTDTPALPGEISVTLEMRLAGALESAASSTRTVRIAAKELFIVNAALTPGHVPVMPYTTWQTAATNIFDVIPYAGDGTIITVSNGVYEISETIVVDHAIKLKSANGAAVTTFKRLTTRPKSANVMHNCVRIDHKDAIVEGFTLSDGWCYYTGSFKSDDFGGAGVQISPHGGVLASCIVTNSSAERMITGGGLAMLSRAAIVTNCVITDNSTAGWQGNGAGVRMLGGLLTHSTICNNNAEAPNQAYAGGLYTSGGGVSHCRFTGNTSKHRAGGIYCDSAIVFDNCIIDGNTSSAEGGGGIYAADGKFVNCTIAVNTATEGGGVRLATAKPQFYNCIIQNNTVTADTSTGAPEWNGLAATFDHCLCPKALPTGSASNLLQIANFKPNTFRLASGAHGFNAGSTNALSFLTAPLCTDFYGEKRISGTAIDIGASEADAESLLCSVIAPLPPYLQGASVTFTAGSSNPTGAELDYLWTDGEKTLGTGEYCEVTLHEAGDFTIYLRASASGEASNFAESSLTYTVAPKEIYVVNADLKPGHIPQHPFTNWVCAATNIHSAYDISMSGSTIFVDEGTYKIANEIALEKGVRIVAVKGPEATIIRRRDTTLDAYQGGAFHRIFRLNHADALVDGFTITGGRLNEQNARGAGVYIEALGGTVTNSIIKGNTMSANMYTYGGGVHMLGGLLTDSIIAGNINETQVGNNGSYGGGIHIAGGCVSSCQIISNRFVTSGSGCSGGGVSATGGSILNCLVAYNTCTGRGGGYAGLSSSSGAALTNCTLIGNSATLSGGGVYLPADASQLVNCIFFGNLVGITNMTSDNVAVASSACYSSFQNCFAALGELPAENGNLTGIDPEFYPGTFMPVRGRSPCHNSGLYADWLANITDIEGNPRVDHLMRIDIGAYETPYVQPATMLFLR